MDNCIHLSNEIYKATKQSLIQLYRTNENFYFFVLVFTGNDYDPFISAWSYEALEREISNKPLSYIIKDIKWSYADSPYLDYGSEFFQKVKLILKDRPSLDNLDDFAWEKEYNFRLQSTIDALKKPEGEEFFNAYQNRNSIMINVDEIPPDYNNTVRAKSLNPIEAIKEWLDECAE